MTVTFPFLKIHCRTLKADHFRSKLQFGASVAADSSIISVYPMLQTQMVREQLQLFKMFGQKYLSLQGLMIQILSWLHLKADRLQMIVVYLCCNCSSVGCLKCVQFYNWFRLH